MSLKLEDIIVINLIDKLIEGNYNKPIITDYDEAMFKDMLKSDLESLLTFEELEMEEKEEPDDSKPLADKSEKDQ